MILLHVVCERASSRVSLFPERFDRVESGVRRSRSCTRVIIYEYDGAVRRVQYNRKARRTAVCALAAALSHLMSVKCHL